MVQLSFAADERKGFVRVGNFEIVPKLSISGKFNTNVFSEADLGNLNPGEDNDTLDPDEAEDDDFIYSLAIGVDAIYPGENISLDFGILGDVRRYSDFDNQDNEDVVGHLTLDFLSPSQRYKFSLGGKHLQTKDPSSNDLQSNEKFALAERSVTSFFGSVDFLLGRSSTIILMISRSNEEYDDNELDQENTETTAFDATYRWKFGQKTSAVFNYQFSMLEYSDRVVPIIVPGEPEIPVQSDSDSHNFNLGLRWDATSKISGRAMVGFTSRDYDENQTVSGSLSSESTFTLGTSLVWKARERTSFNILLNRALEDSSFANASNLVSTSFGLGVDQKIGKKMHADLNGLFTNSDYESDIDRTDNRFSINAGFKYDFKEWLYGKLAYEFQNNSSDLDSREYVVHEIIFKVGTQF